LQRSKVSAFTTHKKINDTIRFGSASQQILVGERRGDSWNTFSSAVSHMKGSADVLGEYTRVLTTTNQFFWSKEAAALH
jgi:hypothetical protein